MAHVHLRVRKDRRAYTEVFRQLVDEDPSPHSLVLLGDAYMAVQVSRGGVGVGTPRCVTDGWLT